MAVQVDNDELAQGTNDRGFGQQHIIKTSTGVLYTIHLISSTSLEVHKSTDGGATWTLDTTLSPGAMPIQMCMCISQLDDVFVMWSQATGTGSQTVYKVQRRSYDTGTWSEKLSYEEVHQSNGATYGLVTYNRNINRLHLFIARGGDNIKMNSRYSDDRGDTWNQGGQWGESTFSGGRNAWALDSNPTTGVYYFFMNYGGTYDTQICSTTGSRTSSEQAITGTVYAGALVVDSAGHRWKAFYHNDGTNYHLKVARDNDGTPSLDVNYSTTDSVVHGMISIGIDASNNLLLLYTKISDNKCYYRFYTSSTTTWGSEHVLSNNEGLRPSCVQRIISGETLLRFRYSTSSL